jgi:hypothetical protein
MFRGKRGGGPAVGFLPIFASGLLWGLRLPLLRLRRRRRDGGRVAGLGRRWPKVDDGGGLAGRCRFPVLFRVALVRRGSRCLLSLC